MRNGSPRPKYLSGWVPHDDPRRERVRAALREGYAGTNRLEEGAGFERRRKLYLGVTRLFPMAWLSLWYGDAEQDGGAESTGKRSGNWWSEDPVTRLVHSRPTDRRALARSC